MEVVNQEIIENEIQDAITQVDETLTLDNLDFDFDKKTRKLHLNFTVKSLNNEIIEINENMG